MLANLMAFFFPDIKSCINCREETDGQLPICKECEIDVTYYVEYNTCDKCGRFYHGPNCDSLIKNMAVARYEGLWKEIIHKFKFNNHQYLAKPLAIKMLERIEKEQYKFDIITYIPVSKKTLKQRGYDQSQLLASQLGKLTNKPVIATLKKSGNRPSQHTLSLEERMLGWEGEFSLKKDLGIKGKRLLLVDDILTTGNTLYHGAKEIEQSGCESIKAIILAN